MVKYRIKTFEDIYNAVSRRIKIPTTDIDFLKACKETINTRYDSVAFRKKWRWRKDRFDIVIPAKYTTGTVAVVNASRTVTGASTVWIADHKDWYFQVTGTNEIYRIVAIDTNAQTFQLSATYVGSSNDEANYKIFRASHGMPPDSGVRIVDQF